MKKKLLIPVILIILTLSSFAIALTIYLSWERENSAERLDLYLMRDVELLYPPISVRDGKISSDVTEFWFDECIFSFVPVSNPIPTPYGKGTKKVGGAVKSFIDETGKNYNYDEAADYTDKVIHVVIDDGSVLMDWR